MQAAKCPICLCFLYLRITIDNRKCPCGAITLAGDGEEAKVFAMEGIDGIGTYEVEINATGDELYEDWYYQEDRLGIIEDIGLKKRGIRRDDVMLPIVYVERDDELDRWDDPLEAFLAEQVDILG